MMHFKLLIEEIKRAIQIVKLRYKFRKRFPNASKNFKKVLNMSIGMSHWTNVDEKEIKSGLPRLPLYRRLYNMRQEEYDYLEKRKKEDSQQSPKPTYSYLKNGNN